MSRDQRRWHDQRNRAARAGIVGRRLIDVLGPAQPLTTFGAAAGVLEIPLADGSLAFGTVRSLDASNGELAILQPRRGAGSLGAPTPR